MAYEGWVAVRSCHGLLLISAVEICKWRGKHQQGARETAQAAPPDDCRIPAGRDGWKSINGGESKAEINAIMSRIAALEAGMSCNRLPHSDLFLTRSSKRTHPSRSDP